MANYKAVASANWSALATWQDDSTGSYVNSTVLPGATDVVYANNFTVTLDINVTVLELRTTTATNVNAGGLFDYGAGCNTVAANIIAGTTTGLRHNLATTKAFIGSATGGSAAASFGILNNSTGQLNVTGNITGGTVVSAYGIINASSGTINITGNCTAGTLARAVSNDSTGTITIIGSSIASVGSFSSFNSGTGIMRVTTAIASSAFSGVVGNVVGGTTIVQNVTNNANGSQGVNGFVRFSNAGPNTFTVTLENGTTQNLVDASVGNPAVTDVRSGVTYASGALTGTCAVPPAASVGFGVPVDNTTGTALFSPQDLFTAIANSSDPIAERLRNVSTVATTAATVAAFDV
jgi:hypothetical protein